MNFYDLNEAIENFIGYTIYCDLDGVLVDLHGGVMRAIGARKELDRVGTVRGLARLVSEGVRMDEFFADLDWTRDGERLWSYMLPYEPLILTAGDPKNPIAEGKNAWCRKNLGIDSGKIIHEHLKERYAAPNAILIDDWGRNIKKFREFGGNGILHRAAGDTIGHLKSFISRKRRPNLAPSA